MEQRMVKGKEMEEKEEEEEETNPNRWYISIQVFETKSWIKDKWGRKWIEDGTNLKGKGMEEKEKEEEEETNPNDDVHTYIFSNLKRNHE